MPPTTRIDDLTIEKDIPAWDSLIRHLETHTNVVWGTDSIVPLMRERQQKGLASYDGRELQKDTCADNLSEAMDELLDACVYLWCEVMASTDKTRVRRIYFMIGGLLAAVKQTQNLMKDRDHREPDAEIDG